MKSLNEYLSTKNLKTADVKAKTSKLESWEKCKGTLYIPADIMHQHIIDALEINWLKPEDILKDFEVKISDNNSAAKIHAAYVDHKLEHYSKFEDTLKEIIENSVYANKIDKILWILFENYLPIFDEIAHEDEN